MPRPEAVMVERAIEGTRWRISGGVVVAGAAVAAGAAWLGEMIGGALSIGNEGSPGAGTWIGGFLALGMTVAGALTGAAIAARASGRIDRLAGAAVGLCVWGLSAAFQSLVFALLGGSIALVAGGTAGMARFALGIGAAGLFLSMGAAVFGGTAAATQRGPRVPRAVGSGREVLRAPEVREAGLPAGLRTSERPGEQPPTH